MPGRPNSGNFFLRKMYSWFLREQPHLCVIANLDGRPVGFAVGAIGGYGRKIFRYALLEIIISLISHPSLLFERHIFKSGMSLLRGLSPMFSLRERNAVSGNGTIKASLSSIAVAGGTQGTGMGKGFLLAFEHAAKARGATVLGLSVERNNIAARRLYAACGWQLQGERAEADSAYYSKCLKS